MSIHKDCLRGRRISQALRHDEWCHLSEFPRRSEMAGYKITTYLCLGNNNAKDRIKTRHGAAASSGTFWHRYEWTILSRSRTLILSSYLLTWRLQIARFRTSSSFHPSMKSIGIITTQSHYQTSLIFSALSCPFTRQLIPQTLLIVCVLLPRYLWKQRASCPRFFVGALSRSHIIIKTSFIPTVQPSKPREKKFSVSSDNLAFRSRRTWRRRIVLLITIACGQRWISASRARLTWPFFLFDHKDEPSLV